MDCFAFYEWLAMTEGKSRSVSLYKKLHNRAFKRGIKGVRLINT